MKKLDLRILCLILLVSVLASCGVDWFPEFKKSPTDPNAFSFTTKVGVPIFSSVSSNSVIITGFANSSTASPISVSTGSAYSINGAPATPSAGTIKNNDSVKVIQTSSNLPATTTISTLTIGRVIGTFTTVTQTIATPAFQQIFPSPVAGFIEISALITGTDLGGHTISMSGTNTQLAISDINNIITTNFTTSTSPLSVPILNNMHIVLLIPSTVVSSTTTLTIDNTNFVISNSSPFTVVSSPK